ncbi:MAG: hypothetical protein SVU32_03265, partial [Candidatus Nanohaloarchaea archaeon]|nr:hypothetical protein [Candidatus Nanohaloarchaea archaeon]
EYGARAEDIRVMRDALEEVEASLGIKASGGVRSAEDVARLREAAGRDLEPDSFRVGTSSGVSLLDSLEVEG